MTAISQPDAIAFSRPVHGRWQPNRSHILGDLSLQARPARCRWLCIYARVRDGGGEGQCAWVRPAGPGSVSLGEGSELVGINVTV